MHSFIRGELLRNYFSSLKTLFANRLRCTLTELLVTTARCHCQTKNTTSTRLQVYNYNYNYDFDYSNHCQHPTQQRYTDGMLPLPLLALLVAAAAAAAAALLFIVRLNRLMLRTPPEVLPYLKEPLTEEAAREAYARVKEKGLDFRSRHPGVLERRYIIVGGSGMLFLSCFLLFLYFPPLFVCLGGLCARRYYFGGLCVTFRHGLMCALGHFTMLSTLFHRHHCFLIHWTGP